AVNRNADIRCVEGRGVIDAVAHVPHDISCFPESKDNPLLLVRLDLGHDVYINHSLHQSVVANLPEFRTCQYLIIRRSDLLTQVGSHKPVVPCDNLQRNTKALEKLYSFHDIGLQWVAEN